MSKISDYDFLELYDVCKSKHDLLIYLYLGASYGFLKNSFISYKFELKYVNLWFTGTADNINLPYLKLNTSGKGNFVNIDGCRNSVLSGNCSNVNQNRMETILEKIQIPFVREFPFPITNRELWIDLCDKVGIPNEDKSFRNKAAICVDFMCPSRVVIEADSKTYHKDVNTD